MIKCIVIGLVCLFLGFMIGVIIGSDRDEW